MDTSPVMSPACQLSPPEMILMHSPQNLSAFVNSGLYKEKNKVDLNNALARMNFQKQKALAERKQLIKRNSLTLLEQEFLVSARSNALLDLTQQDCEVNAPVNNLLLEGDALLGALEVTSTNI